VKKNNTNYQDLSLFRLPEAFRGRNPFYVQLWWIIQSLLISTSPQFMYGWRRMIYRLFGAKIGKNVLIRPSVKMTYPWNVEIGENTWIGDSVILYSLDKIFIGSNVVISQNSYICTGTHNFTKINFDIERYPIFIENQVWIASDVFVGPGVTIDRGAVVGTRSSVFNNLPPEMVCSGTPAKPIKPRIAQ
tara:strand:+ start:21698 stop:22264 length:567 start_codon:yes stop_codon:yes gene_type:complete